MTKASSMSAHFRLQFVSPRNSILLISSHVIARLSLFINAAIIQERLNHV